MVADGEPIEVRAVRLGASWRWMIVGALVAVCGAVMLVREIAHPSVFQRALTAFVVLVVGVTVIGDARARRTPRGKDQSLRASEDGLRWGADLVVAAEEIRSVPIPSIRSDETVLRMERRNGRRLEFAAPTLQAAREVRAALRKDRFSAATFEVDGVSVRGSRSLEFLLFVLGALVIIGVMTLGRALWPRAPESVTALGQILGAVVPTWLAQRARRGTAVIGLDGVVLRSSSRERFVPARDLVGADVVEIEKGTQQGSVVVRLRLRHDAHLDVAVMPGSWFAPSSARLAALGRAGAMAEHVRMLVAARPLDALDEAFEIATLERSSRPLEDWLAALRSMTVGVDTFRDDVTRRVRALSRVLEDPIEPALLRAAAAVALARSDEPGVGKRIADVATATAAPRLRAALDAVTNGDEAKLRDALAALEAAEGEGATHRGGARRRV